MKATKQNKGIYKKWYFWVGIVGAVVLAGSVLAICLNGFNLAQKATCEEIYNRGGGGAGLCAICTGVEGGNIGPCGNYTEIEIVARPEKQTECPVGTKPAYSVVGGFVGLAFVGCTKD